MDPYSIIDTRSRVTTSAKLATANYRRAKTNNRYNVHNIMLQSADPDFLVEHLCCNATEIIRNNSKTENINYISRLLKCAAYIANAN